jgi:thiamine kinase-like enzyme
MCWHSASVISTKAAIYLFMSDVLIYHYINRRKLIFNFIIIHMQPINEVFEIMCSTFPDFKSNFEPNDLKVSKLSSWSNQILLVQISKPYFTNRFLIRYFGNVSKVVRQEVEKKMFSVICHMGYGLSNYKCTDKYRVEKYLESNQITGLMMRQPKIMLSYAQTLSEFHHNRELRIALAEYCPQKPFALEVLEQWGGLLIKEIPNWLLLCKNDKQRDILNEFKLLFTPEFDAYYRKVVGKCSAELVCSHNDIHAGNMILLPDSKVLLIDYEYMNFNPRAFDLATYASESTCNYACPLFPFFRTEEEARLSDAEIKSLCQEYLKDVYNALSMKAVPVEEYVSSELEKIFRETQLLIPIVNVFWAIWALLMVNWSVVDDDRFAFAQEKLHLYYRLREKADTFMD